MSSQPAYAPFATEGVTAPPRRAGLNLPALFALITGVLLISPVAIVLGHIAIVQVRRRRQSGMILAIIGLVLGYLGLIAMIVALVSLVMFVNSGPTPPTTF